MPQSASAIGPYSIEREIGRGGMGVVYLATDSRLGRKVAVKALPEHLAQDPDRLARFEREARTLASLNHPNVAGIHGVEEANGLKHLILEYVEGETLQERLERGALGVEEAVEVCAQIAAGMEAAHDAGIVHRDLKPGNVKITPEDKVKILDFGLAKSIDSPASSSSVNLTQSPTISTPAHSPTIPGAIMGTAPYMSPEQARGRAVDKRTDIWAFGVVLYECLTGDSPFQGETVTDSIAAILHKDVDFDALPRGTPMIVRHVLSRCLERDRHRRLHDIGDARIELEAAREGRDALRTTALAAPKSGRSALLVLAAMFAIVAAGAIGWLTGSSAAPTAGADLSGLRMQRLTDDVSVESHAAPTPDGASLIFASPIDGDWDIYMQRVGGARPVNLTSSSPAADTAPAVSPDGAQIAFRSERNGGGIFIMGATGESPRRITDFGFDPCWSADGASVFIASEPAVNPLSRGSVGRLWRVTLADGRVEDIPVPDAMQPSCSPHGERLAFWAIDSGGRRDIFTTRPDGSDPVNVTNDGAIDWSPTWSPDGGTLYYVSDRGGTMGVWRVAIDERSGEPKGGAELIIPGNSAAPAYPRLSADGRRLFFTLTSGRPDVVAIPFDSEKGEIVGPAKSVWRSTNLAWLISASPDGEWLALTMNSPQEDIVVCRVDGSERRMLTNDAHKDRGPVWSPDGERIYFYSDRSGSYQAWSCAPDGGGLTMVGDFAPTTVVLPKISPAGDEMIFGSFGQGVLRVPLKDGRAAGPPRPLEHSEQLLMPVDWSADGSRILCVSDRLADNPTLAVFDLNSGEKFVLEGSAIWACWLPDNETIVACDGSGLSLVDSRTGEGRRLTQFPEGESTPTVAISRDGRTLYLPRSHAEADIWLAELPPPSR